MAECTKEETDVALQLLEEVESAGGVGGQYQLWYYIEAAKSHGTKARDFLIKECEICMEKHTIHEVSAPVVICRSGITLAP